MTDNLAPLPVSEADRQAAVLCGKGAERLAREGCTSCLAHLHGWRGMHVRPLRTRHGWATGTSADLGEGWPDLALFHPKHGALFVEMKSRRGRLSDAQADVRDWLRLCGFAVLVVRDPFGPELSAALAGRTPMVRPLGVGVPR